ncbi:Cryptochrome-2 [Homalodisca vitripennis]|nr:Cryptochrome-2 [Homalodisca vitripennis]
MKVFEDLLLDADWSVNAGSWMWHSNSSFFQQFFSCYCPVRFGRKADPNGEFIRKYLPVLKNFPTEHIHDPWTASEDVQKASNCVIGRDYPVPMVNHSEISAINSQRMRQVFLQLKKYRGPASTPKYPCGLCGIGVKYSGIKCTGPCCNWYHAGCANVTDKRLKELKIEGANVWTCNGCTVSTRQQQEVSQRQEISLHSELEIRSADSPLKSYMSNRPQNFPYLHNRTNSLNNSLADIENSLVESNFLEDITNKEDKLEMAAKIGTTLLEKNKLLEEKNLRLVATIARTEEKLEEL